MSGIEPHKLEIGDRVMERDESRTEADTVHHRRDLYESALFRTEAGRLLGVEQSRLGACIDNLLASNAIPRPVHDSTEVAAAEDIAFILAALGAGTTDATTQFQVAKRILFMEFQCEFGEQATDDRKGRRREPVDPYKDRFGTQVAKTIREVWAYECGGSCAAITVGWAIGHPIAYGLVEFHPPYRETTYLYSTAHVFPNLHEGIGVFHGLELNLVGKIEASAAALQSLGRLLHDEVFSVVHANSRTAQPCYIIADPAMNAGWTHLFERKNSASGIIEVVELECRFVYDVAARRLVHLDLFEQGIVAAGSEPDIFDLEDSLNHANPDAIRDPRQAGLDVSSQLPAWSRRR